MNEKKLKNIPTLWGAYYPYYASSEPHRVQCPECVSHFTTQGCGPQSTPRLKKKSYSRKAIVDQLCIHDNKLGIKGCTLNSINGVCQRSRKLSVSPPSARGVSFDFSSLKEKPSGQACSVTPCVTLTLLQCGHSHLGTALSSSTRAGGGYVFINGLSQQLSLMEGSLFFIRLSPHSQHSSPNH